MHRHHRCRSPDVRRNKIAFLLDTDNVVINLDPSRISLPEALDKTFRYLSKLGRVVIAEAFGPDATLREASDALKARNFALNFCPKVLIDKDAGAQTDKKDTVDPEIMRVGTIYVNEMEGLTHLALGSGDSHFEPFIRWAEAQGLKIIIVAGNRRSLSPKIEALASPDGGGRKMVCILSP